MNSDLLFPLCAMYFVLEDFPFLPYNCWKENKNRFVFSYLASLVELGVFESVTVNFFLVGHTGNEVDQVSFS